VGARASCDLWLREGVVLCGLVIVL
jgi:hypothetical protein